MRWALLQTALKLHGQKGDSISLNKWGCQCNSSVRACSFQNRQARSLQVFEASWGELADHGLWPWTHRITQGTSNYTKSFSCCQQVCLWQGDSIAGFWGAPLCPREGAAGLGASVGEKWHSALPDKMNRFVCWCSPKKATNEWTLPALLRRPNYIIRVDPSAKISVSLRGTPPGSGSRCISV